jgi:hypothetical protein
MPPPQDLRQDFVHRQLRRLHDLFDRFGDEGMETDRGDAASPEAVRGARDAIATALRREQLPTGDYYSRSPVVSLVQSALRDEREVREAADDAEVVDGMVEGIAGSILARLLDGSHAFCDAPARADLGTNVRLVLIGDWGTGREDAARVAAQARRFLEEAEVPAHLIHLGDTYFSGTRREARRNMLGPWPVAEAEAGRFGSWALNGNHDMYTGGHGLFDVTLADPRFARQRAGDEPTTWFVLSTAGWNIVGLDTSWEHPELTIRGDQLFVEGDLGHLHGRQAEVLDECAGDERRLLVLSHHQLFSAYDESHFTFGSDRAAATPMAEELAGVLARREIDAWFWGHEHDCLAYDEHFGGVRFARAIGHGGVPTPVPRTPATPLGAGYPDFVVKPEWREGDSDALRAVRWEYRAEGREDDGRRLCKRGLAVLDIDARDLRVSYVDEDGEVWLTETLC